MGHNPDDKIDGIGYRHDDFMQNDGAIATGNAADEEGATEHRSRVFLVDDSAELRASLAEVINAQPDMTVCGEAENAAQALVSISVSKPDLAIVDISLEGKSGIELIRELRVSGQPLPMVVFTMHPESAYKARALEAGAQAYVRKNEGMQRLLAAIRDALQSD